MLSILRQEGIDVPKDSRTLLKTPRNVEIISRDEWSYHYVGIQKSINLLAANSFPVIQLIINVDGLPLFKCTNLQLWPILGSIFGCSIVFPIAYYYSNKKPENVESFLKDFLNEASLLTSNGIVIGRQTLTFNLKAIVSDAPARSFWK